jgi:hypothetical protein
METQNVTLAIKKNVLRKAKVIAVKRQTSLSRLLNEYIEEIVTQDDEYEQAMQRQLTWLEQGFDLGTGGQATWTRDELHER